MSKAQKPRGKDGRPKMYTRTFVVQELTDLLGKLEANEDIVYSGELIKGKSYSKYEFSRWGSAYPDDIEIQGLLDRMKGILETRAVVGGLRNKLNPSITKFHLINNFDWKDKSEVDHSNKGEKFDINPLSPSMVAIAKKYEEEMKKQVI